MDPDAYTRVLRGASEQSVLAALSKVSPADVGRKGEQYNIGVVRRFGNIRDYTDQVRHYMRFRDELRQRIAKLESLAATAEELYPQDVMRLARKYGAYVPLMYVKRGYGMLPFIVQSTETDPSHDVMLATGINDDGSPHIRSVQLQADMHDYAPVDYITARSLNLDRRTYLVKRVHDVSDFLVGKHVRETVSNEILDLITKDGVEISSDGTETRAGVLTIEVSRIYADHQTETDTEIMSSATVKITLTKKSDISSVVLNGIIREGEIPEITLVPKIITRISSSVPRVGLLTPSREALVDKDGSVRELPVGTAAMDRLGKSLAEKYQLFDVPDNVRAKLAGRIWAFNQWFGIRKNYTSRVLRVTSAYSDDGGGGFTGQASITKLGSHPTTSTVETIDGKVIGAFEGGRELTHVLMFSGVEFSAVKAFYYQNGTNVCIAAKDLFLTWVSKLLFRLGLVKGAMVDGREIAFTVTTADVRSALFHAMFMNIDAVALPTEREVTHSATFGDGDKLHAHAALNAIKQVVYKTLSVEMSEAVIHDGMNVIHTTTNVTKELKTALPPNDFCNIQMARFGFSLLYATLWEDKTLIRRLPDRQLALITIPLSLTNRGLLVHKMTGALKRVFSRYFGTKGMTGLSAIRDGALETRVLGTVTAPLTKETDSGNAQVNLRIVGSTETFGLDSIISGIIDVLLALPLDTDRSGVVYTPFFLIYVTIKKKIEVYLEPEPRHSQILISTRNRVFKPSSETLQSGGGALAAVVGHFNRDD
jgi:hypothetical protein